MAAPDCVTVSVIGQTALPLFICGKEQALERTCDVEATIALPIGLELTIEAIPVYIYIGFHSTLKFCNEELGMGAFEEAPPDHDGIIFPADQWPAGYGDARYYGELLYRYWSNNPLLTQGHTIQGAFEYDAIVGAWTSVPTEDFDITGMPSNPVAPYYFTIEGTPVPSPGQIAVPAFFDTTPSTNRDYVSRYIQPTGSEIPIGLPFVDGEFFKEGYAAIEIWGNQKSFPGTEGTDKGVYGSGAGFRQWLYKVYPAVASGPLITWPPIGMTIDYRGRVYEFWGCKVVERDFIFGDYADVLRMPGAIFEDFPYGTARVYVIMRTLDPGVEVSISLGIEITSAGAPADTGGGGIPGDGWDLDFLGEVYTRNGVTVAIADNIDKPDRVDATEGLAIPEDDLDGPVAAIGDLLTDLLLMNWTVVIEYQPGDEDYGVVPLWLHEPDDFNSFSVYHQTFLDRVEVADSGFIIREVDIDIPVFLGVHKIAITRTATFLSVSVDGGSVSTSTVHVVIPTNMAQPTLAGFGGPVGDYSYNNCFIRRITLTEPVADADLPGLSS